ncbi:hypothetical protein Tco_0726046 [Tanacetum coccineum]|uniref:Uncharacterized protein n=1 Tax=Tanacetum coccineum TaxID=301880 RepID=A0ABQ4YGT7_9ASTR
MPSTLLDMQDDKSKSDVEKCDNETAQSMDSSYKRHRGETNDLSLCELDEYDFYDGYDDVVLDLTEERLISISDHRLDARLYLVSLARLVERISEIENEAENKIS